MEKIKLIAAAFIVMFGALGANAQSFGLDKDTSKGYWTTDSSPIELHIKASNTSSSPVTINWRMSSLYKDIGWSFDGACDNVDCKYDATPGLTNGATTFSAFPINSGEFVDFKIDFKTNNVALNTKAYAVVDMSTTGGAIKKAVFIAYRNALGISTSILQDNDIAIYPNPAQNYIDVVYSPSSDVKTIAIYNLIGKAVSVYKVTDKNSARCEFNAEMPSGIYVVRVADSKGAVIATRKITRQ